MQKRFLKNVLFVSVMGLVLVWLAACGSGSEEPGSSVDDEIEVEESEELEEADEAEVDGEEEAADEEEEAAESASGVTYEVEVREIINNNCLSCHGADSPLTLETYDDVVNTVYGDQAGALMRTLDNGENTDDGEPGSMYKFLGETDEEREEHLAVIKEWVGNWSLDSDLTEDDFDSTHLVES